MAAHPGLASTLPHCENCTNWSHLPKSTENYYFLSPFRKVCILSDLLWPNCHFFQLENYWICNFSWIWLNWSWCVFTVLAVVMIFTFLRLSSFPFTSTRPLSLLYVQTMTCFLSPSLSHDTLLSYLIISSLSFILSSFWSIRSRRQTRSIALSYWPSGDSGFFSPTTTSCPHPLVSKASRKTPT